MRDKTPIEGLLPVRLRDLRQLRGLSLAQVARAASVTKGYLSKVEAGVATPSVAVLTQLAKVYNISISELFDEGDGTSRFSLVRAGERRRFDRGGRELGYVYEAVSFRKSDRIAEAFFLTMPALTAADPHPTFKHKGEEVFICLQGRIHFVYGPSEYVLDEGDCIQFDPSVEHRGEAYGGQPAQALVVILPKVDRPQAGKATPKKSRAGLRPAAARPTTKRATTRRRNK
jgi:transcriptional regulator with XRE-family HTH domain